MEIIYLRRENMLLQVLSNFISNERKSFHKRDDSNEEFHFHINLEEFEKNMLERIAYTKNEQAALNGRNYLEIVYENDIEPATSHQATVDKILAFSGLETGNPVATTFRKVNTKKTKDIIENYKEFEAYIESKGWKHYLDN